MLNSLLHINARPSVLDQLSRDVDRLFEATTGISSALTQAWPGLNAWQEGEQYVLEAEVPGFGADDIELDVTDDTIIIRGQRERSTPEGANTIRLERSVTRFERSFRFPLPIDQEGIDATLSNGVLRICIPIAQTARPRRIQIKQSDTQRIEQGTTNALPEGEAKEREPEPSGASSGN